MKASLFWMVVRLITSIVSATDIGINYMNIALLVSPEAEINNIALRNSIDLINKEILNPSGAGRLLNVFKVVVRSGTVLDEEILYGRNLSKASFILEPHQVDPLSCVLSELLRVPHVTLVDEHHTQCKNVISMRPDPKQLNDALIAMIKEDQPRVVAVISEESLGEMATGIMSHDQLVNKFYFQVIATVNFYHPSSIRRAISELKASAIKKVLLLIQSRNLDLVMNEANRQIVGKTEYRWYIPMVGFKERVDLTLMDGLTGLQFPTDAEVENDTMYRLRAMKGINFMPVNTPISKEIDPLFHDALTAIAYSTINYARASREWQQLPNGSSSDYCPVRNPAMEDKSHVDHMKEVLFQGLSGLVKFTKGGYRNITNLEVIEVDDGYKKSMGMWSSQCQAFRWNPAVTYAKKEEQAKKCNQEDENEDRVTFKPRKRFLRVVTNPEAPFMFYNESKEGNDRFSGFCKDLLDRLATELDFKYDMYVTTKGTYGSKVNGTWDGMIRELIDKRADIAIGSLTITSSRETAIDFSKPFMDFTMTLIMKKPTKRDLDVFAFLKPFQGEVWLSIIGVTFIVTFFMFLMDRYSPYGYRNLAATTGEGAGDEFSIHNCLWFATASMLQQGPDQTPKSGSGRTLSAAFWFFILIIISTYTANLAAFFTTSTITSKINSLNDLANQDEMEYGILQSGQTYDFFRDAKIPLYKKMFQTMEEKQTFARSTKSAVERVRKESYAYLTEDPALSYENMRKPCTTMLLQNLLEAKSYGLGLQSNSEWTNPISVQILDLRELGFVEQLRMKWWDEKSECITNTKTSDKPDSLELSNMAGVYIIMAGGIGLAFILLLVETKYTSLFRGRCFARGELVPRQEPKRKEKQTDLTYFEYRNNHDMYDTNLKINVNARKSERETVLARPSLHDHFDTPDLYRDAPESTL